jgi:hypothetical protein
LHTLIIITKGLDLLELQVLFYTYPCHSRGMLHALSKRSIQYIVPTSGAEVEVHVLEAKEKLLGHQHPDMIKARASVTNANKIRTQRNLAFRLTRQ